MKKINWKIFLLILLSAKACHAYECVHVQNSFLDDNVYLILKNELRENDGVCFKNIEGGKANLLMKFSRLIAGRPIRVFGYCNSLCAQLALTSDDMIIYKSGDIKNPSTMVIHGTFNVKTKEWHESSLDNVEMYFDRLKILPKYEIIKALSIKEYGKNGLIISTTPLPDLYPSKSLVHLCESYPKKCKSMAIYDLKEMNIQVR